MKETFYLTLIILGSIVIGLVIGLRMRYKKGLRDKLH
jgi:hypothetical protein